MSVVSTTVTDFPPIETWANEHSQRNYTIHIETHEFTSVCPKTGLPDFGILSVDYIPDRYVIELKAFKYYLVAYRNHGIFYENVVNRILNDIVTAIDPRFVEVAGRFTVRGGLSTTVKAVYCQKGFDPPGSA